MNPNVRSLLAEAAYRKALCYELEYGCCPQCVLSTVQETVEGVVSDDVIKASHGLSGGGGLSGHGTCGALTGGLIALSCRRGRDRDKLHRGRFMGNFQLGRELVERFRAEFDGVTCDHLQRRFTGRTYDMWDADEYAAFDRAREQQCARASGLVAKWVIELL